MMPQPVATPRVYIAHPGATARSIAPCPDVCQLGMMAWVSETIIFVLSGVIIANRVRVAAFSASDFGMATTWT